MVEEPPAAGGDQADSPTWRELRQRVRQQEILAELGVLSLKGTPFPELLDRTAQLAAEGLRAEFSKVMEYRPQDQRLLVRAGVGWPAGIVGSATVGADLASPAGFALQTGKPVISNHLENEERFRTPELLLEHGVRRAMNVILQGNGTPFGVLEVDSRSEGEFGEHDIAFLQGAANLLGMAIERQRIEGSLRSALEQHEVLLQELDHRVSNSLQLVISMLHLQAAGTLDAGVRSQLHEASSRIAAIARAHRRLRRSDEVRQIDLAGYLGELCTDLAASVGGCRIEAELTGPAPVPTNRAVSVALILTELVTNAAKHAYRGADTGTIRVRLEPAGAGGGGNRLAVADDGPGLPAGFAVEGAGGAGGLGMRISLALAQQLGGRLEAGNGRGRHGGAEFALVLPAAGGPSTGS